MNTRFVLALSCVVFSTTVLAQDVLNMRTGFVPNVLDSNNFYYSVSFSYIVPKKEATTFQKSRLREDAIQGNRLTKAKMEMVLFPLTKYKQDIHPHLFVRLDMIPSSYLSSRFGAGVSSKKLQSSLGVFYGTYYRRVPYESNFITRRKRSFENYNLTGVYLQSSSVDANFFFALALEKTHTFISARVGIVAGNFLCLGEAGSRLRTLEGVMHYETLSGFGLGAAVAPFDGMRFETLWVVPDPRDVEEQARLQTKLTRGVLVSVSYFVN